jgi:hypothetical protein
VRDHINPRETIIFIIYIIRRSQQSQNNYHTSTLTRTQIEHANTLRDNIPYGSPNGQQTTDSRQQAAGSRQQRGESREQRADSRQQTADSRQQTADSRQQTADSRQQTANSRQAP